MTEHPRNLPGYESISDLAKTVSNLRYDSLSDFLGALSEELDSQAKSDLAKGRPRLNQEVTEAARHLHEAAGSLKRAWIICKPYMEKSK